MRLVQIVHESMGRRVAVVREPELVVLDRCRTMRELAELAIAKGAKLSGLAGELTSRETIPYDSVYSGLGEWRLLAPYDHPEPARLLVTGTGLTHRKSADSRQSMHSGTAPVSDSMKMYQIGVEGGRPARGEVGAAPEWFYKGTGAIVRAQNEALEVPAHGNDGGEEAEIAGVYQVGADGTVYRLGMVQANEFSDHVMESKNYLYLAPSKLRQCAIGPELVVDVEFEDVAGTANVIRNGTVVWTAKQASGDRHMCHTLANLEHHHFKHSAHRLPGDAHLHFFGADHFSFKDKLVLADGDVMEIAFEGFGRPLRNPIKIVGGREGFVGVREL